MDNKWTTIKAYNLGEIRRKGKLGSSFKIGKFKMGDEKIDTNKYRDKVKLVKKLEEMIRSKSGSRRQVSAEEMKRGLMNQGLKNNQKRFRDKIMDELIPPKKGVSEALKAKDISPIENPAIEGQGGEYHISIGQDIHSLQGQREFINHILTTRSSNISLVSGSSMGLNSKTSAGETSQPKASIGESSKLTAGKASQTSAASKSSGFVRPPL